jgi:hypothetical protein
LDLGRVVERLIRFILRVSFDEILVKEIEEIRGSNALVCGGGFGFVGIFFLVQFCLGVDFGCGRFLLRPGGEESDWEDKFKCFYFLCWVVIMGQDSKKNFLLAKGDGARLFERMKDDREEWDLFNFRIVLVFRGNIFCC